MGTARQKADKLPISNPDIKNGTILRPDSNNLHDALPKL